jgi:DNA polymerase delta subunit 1
MSGYRSTQMETTFQHLDTVPCGGNGLFLFGRQLNGESVAIKVENIRPHFCIQYTLARNNILSFVNSLANNVWFYQRSCSAYKRFNDPTIKSDKPITIPSRSDKPYKNYIDYEIFEGQDIVNYSEDGPGVFLKLSFDSSYTMYRVKQYLTNEYVTVYSDHILKDPNKNTGKKGEIKDLIQVDEKTFGVHTLYNDHVDFTLQWLIDKNIYSCAFIKASGHDKKKETSCDIEFTADQIEQVDVKDMAPWRILSWDIESVPRPIPGKKDKYLFPEPWKDSICTIGATLQIGNETTLHTWILNAPVGSADRNKTERLNKLDNPPDEYRPEEASVYFFDSELAMIQHFIKFIIEQDVDFLEGHNVNRFDNTYLLDRYSQLVDGFKKKEELRSRPILGRMLNKKSTYTVKVFQSNQKGANKKYKTYLPGRVVLDSYDIMKDQHNESSYALNNLAAKYLGTKKIAQDYNDIYPMWHSQQGRHDLAVYCIKDSWLVRKMMDKLCKLTVFLQMSNVCGISMKDVIERGQGIRTIGLMLRYAKKRNPQYFIPHLVKQIEYVSKKVYNMNTGKVEIIKKEKPPESFEGAVVVDPTTGFYKDAVSCLDFASLYPSIMRALNMSYETLVSEETVKRMGWKELVGKEEAVGVRTIPDYDYTNMKLTTIMNRKNPIFVSASTRKGLLPEILESVLHERKIVKKMMKSLNDPSCNMYKVYDGRQLGLKVVANSIYGFTGAIHGFLPEKRIASSVTKYGRYMITQTKSKVENHPVWGAGGHKCQCIYGDTDSVFVHMPRSLVDGKDEKELMENAHKTGTEMADYVTNIFLPPNELEYEKSYSSFLLLKKKRYAGHKYEPGHPPKLQIKGLEAARRDYAPLLVETQKKMLNILLLDRDIQKACDFVSKVVYDLMNNKTPLKKLIMSKKLSRDPKDYKAIAAHVNLALRLAKETPQTAPVSGDRVDFIIYNSGSSKVAESACLPSEIESGKYTIDVNYYMEKQLKGPLLRILEKVVSNPKQLFQCNSLFKQRCSAGIMASFLGKRTYNTKTTQVQYKKMKQKKPSIQQSLAMIFGKKK